MANNKPKDPRTMSPFEPGYKENLIAWHNANKPADPSGFSPFSPEGIKAKAIYDAWTKEGEQINAGNYDPLKLSQKQASQPAKKSPKPGTVFDKIIGGFADGLNVAKIQENKQGPGVYDGKTAPAIWANNPFALIQVKPDNWLGLIGVNKDSRDIIPDGFLIFDTKQNGLRAGLLNLYNVYFRRNDGISSIEKIFRTYAPAGHGNNDPGQYMDTAQKLSGIPKNKLFPFTNKQNVIKLSRAIITVEAGKNWVTDAEIGEAYDAVAALVGLKPISKNSKKTIEFLIIGGVVLVLLGSVVYAIKQN